jgi:heavy metal translocating P-type ATPase
MKYTVVHELPGRLRINLRVPGRLIDPSHIEKRILGLEGVRKVSFNVRTNSLLVLYRAAPRVREDVHRTIAELPLTLPKRDGRQPDPLEQKKTAVIMAGGLLLASPLIPLPVKPFLALYGALPIFNKGVSSLLKRRISVDVLDSSAIAAAIGLRDFRTAGIITFLLKVGEYLDEWTRERSRKALLSLFTVHDEWAWVKKNGSEERVALGEVRTGDLVVARAGSYIPVDGVVVDGEAMVNQSSLTGEPFPVPKRQGLTVYAGTALEEGVLLIRTEKAKDETRIAQVVKVIQESEGLKADVQSHAEMLADRIVPYVFLLSGLTYAVTGSALRAASTLLVDYSCAIRLSTPLAVMSAMMSTAHEGVLIKGGKFIEKLSKSDVFVLDKTGTLTEASPRVIEVITFNGHGRDYILKHSACVEEHFPHPIARAVVKLAQDEGIVHDEEHSKVEYVVAHGIASSIKGRRILVGSRHFVSDDEGVDTRTADERVRLVESRGYSVLYVAIEGKLAGLIAVEDPLREEAAEFLRQLRETGVQRILMLTGDTEIAAGKAARDLGLHEYYSQAFPEQKTELVRRLRDAGHVVAMVGDGINDSAALAHADVGISMKHGADIAKEACDVLLMEGGLTAIIAARRTSQRTMSLIRRNYRYIVGVNSALIGLSLFGLLSPAASALLHNVTTVATAASSMRMSVNGRPGELRGKVLQGLGAGRRKGRALWLSAALTGG